MTEDAETSAPPWWKASWYKDAMFENELIESIRAKDKPNTGVIYRLFLGICGILLFLAGWVLWNIALPAEGESSSAGMNLETLLFFTGLFVQFILAPYFAFVSISSDGRLSPFVPKAQLEYLRLKGAILNKDINNHYWAALRDPNHKHHNEIIRYKWMDKIRWKHHPSDFFGYVKLTKESGGTSTGRLVPKSSAAYRNSNFDLDEDGKPVSKGATHPLKRLLTLPMLLFFFSLLSFPIAVVNATTSVVDKDWELLLRSSISFLLLIFLGYYLIRRNTDLINADDDVDVSVEDLEERLRLLSERYLTIPKSVE